MFKPTQGRLSKAVSLLALAIGLTLLPSVSVASCVNQWRDCRSDADREFREGRAGVFWYSILLDGCDIGYGVCSLSKEKENGK